MTETCNTFIQIHYEDFAVSDLFCPGTFNNRLDCFFNKILVDCYFKPYLLKQVYIEGHTTVTLVIALLSATAK